MSLGILQHQEKFTVDEFQSQKLRYVWSISRLRWEEYAKS